MINKNNFDPSGKSTQLWMIHADELQDALNRPPLNKVYSLAGIPPQPAFAVKYPANLNEKNAI